MSYHSRFFTPGASRKRKESDAYFPSTSAKPLVHQTSVSRAVSGNKPFTTSYKRAEQQQPVSNNRLLAGCLAHEFLTKGTLLGQKFDPARAEVFPVSSAEPKRNRMQSQTQSHVQAINEAEPSGKLKSKQQSYAEVANLLKGDGAHIPGVINPTQLARWIQM